MLFYGLHSKLIVIFLLKEIFVSFTKLGLFAENTASLNHFPGLVVLCWVMNTFISV